MKVPVLNSQRLTLKPLDYSYATEAYVSWMNDVQVTKYLESGGGYSMDMLKAYLKDIDKREMLFWAIHDEVGKHIGNIKIDPINWRNGIGEYGIMMGDKPSWGKGYGREATLLVIDFCFSEAVGLRKIMLGVVQENVAAVQLYKKVGFVVEGVYKKHAFHEEKWCDVIRMSIFNADLNVK